MFERMVRDEQLVRAPLSNYLGSPARDSIEIASAFVPASQLAPGFDASSQDAFSRFLEI